MASRSPSIVQAPSTPSAQYRGAGDRLRAHDPGDHGHRRALHRCGADRVGALEGRLAGPDASHARHLLVHPLPPAGERAPDGAVVVLAPADAHTHGQPAVGQHVDRGQRLRHRHLVVGREDDDRRPQPDPLGERGRGREVGGPVVAGVGDPLRHRQARPRTAVDLPAPRERLAASAAASSAASSRSPRVPPASVLVIGGRRREEGTLPRWRRAMKLGVVFGYWGAAPRAGFVEEAQEAERLGYDSVWVAESWGNDAFTYAAYVAANTSTIKIGTGIVQMAARTPTATTMAAVTLDHLSNGRLILGLGVSGPQVVEGWYGQPSNRPLARTREYVDIIRRALRPRGAARERRRVLPPPLPGRGQPGPGQAAEDHDPPAARRHPDLPRGRGPEERDPDRGDRRRLAAALLLAVPPGRLRRPAEGRQARVRDQRDRERHRHRRRRRRRCCR